MANVTERQPGVWFAPCQRRSPPRRQAVRREVAEWEAELAGHAPSSVGATVADLLTMWQEARATGNP